jgi:hypothetical protein
MIQTLPFPQLLALRAARGKSAAQAIVVRHNAIHQAAPASARVANKRGVPALGTLPT